MPVHTFKTLRAAGSSGAYFRRTVLVRLAVFLAITLPLVWLLVSVERSQLDTIARRQSNLDVQNLAHAFSEEVNATINTIDLSLLHLRDRWEHDRDGFPAAVERLGRDLHERLLLQVSVTDARGRLAYSSAGRADGRDLSDREHVRVHLDDRRDRLFVSGPVLGRMTGKWSVQFTRPIVGKDGQLQGVIVASVAPGYFSRFYADIELGPGASIALLRSDGTIIARTTRGDDNKAMGKVLKGYPYNHDHPIGQAASGHFHRVGQVDGVERFYAWRDLPNYPLMVTVGQSVEDANARFARQKWGLTGGGIVASLALALLGWVALAASDNRQRAIAAMQAAEARLKLALNAAGEGVWDSNFATGTIALSPQAQAILETDTATVPLTIDALKALIHPDDVGAVWHALRDHFEGKTPDYRAEYRVRLRSGHWRWLLARGMLAERAPDGSPLRMVGTLVDIDARKGAEEQMRHQAHHDVLTGLPNRLLFADRLEQAMRVAQRERTGLAVLYFDLDGFKPVNDTHGHAAGDALLAEVARRVGASLRESDTLARLGGDEFVVLLPRCADGAQACKVGENILAQLNRAFEVEGKVLRISGSIGYALFPEHGADSESLLRSADVAMYAAKAGGRGRVCGPASTAARPDDGV